MTVKDKSLMKSGNSEGGPQEGKDAVTETRWCKKSAEEAPNPRPVGAPGCSDSHWWGLVIMLMRFCYLSRKLVSLVFESQTESGIFIRVKCWNGMGPVELPHPALNMQRLQALRYVHQQSKTQTQAGLRSTAEMGDNLFQGGDSRKDCDGEEPTFCSFQQRLKSHKT